MGLETFFSTTGNDTKRRENNCELRMVNGERERPFRGWAQNVTRVTKHQKNSPQSALKTSKLMGNKRRICNPITEVLNQ